MQKCLYKCVQIRVSGRFQIFHWKEKKLLLFCSVSLEAKWQNFSEKSSRFQVAMHFLLVICSHRKPQVVSMRVLCTSQQHWIQCCKGSVVANSSLGLSKWQDTCPLRHIPICQPYHELEPLMSDALFLCCKVLFSSDSPTPRITQLLGWRVVLGSLIRTVVFYRL